MSEKYFENTTEEKSKERLAVGSEILYLLLAKYGEPKQENFSEFMNSLCASFVILVRAKTDKEDYVKITKLLCEIILINLGVEKMIEEHSDKDIDFLSDYCRDNAVEIDKLIDRVENLEMILEKLIEDKHIEIK